MKQVLFVCVAIAMGVAFTNTAGAQQKIGYFDEQLVLQLFPGIGKVDTLMNSFQNDSLRAEYMYRLGDYQHRDSAYRKDSATMSPKARELAEQDLSRAFSILQGWSQYSQQQYDGKLQSLLLPYRQKIYEALKQVVAEQKYTYVLNESALATNYIQPPILDNLAIRVAMKLKLPLTKEIEDAWKAASGAAGGAAPKK